VMYGAVGSRGLRPHRWGGRESRSDRLTDALVESFQRFPVRSSVQENTVVDDARRDRDQRRFVAKVSRQKRTRCASAPRRSRLGRGRRGGSETKRHWSCLAKPC